MCRILASAAVAANGAASTPMPMVPLSSTECSILEVDDDMHDCSGGEQFSHYHESGWRLVPARRRRGGGCRDSSPSATMTKENPIDVGAQLDVTTNTKDECDNTDEEYGNAMCSEAASDAENKLPDKSGVFNCDREDGRNDSGDEFAAEETYMGESGVDDFVDDDNRLSRDLQQLDEVCLSY